MSEPESPPAPASPEGYFVVVAYSRMHNNRAAEVIRCDDFEAAGRLLRVKAALPDTHECHVLRGRLLQFSVESRVEMVDADGNTSVLSQRNEKTDSLLVEESLS